MCNRYDAAKWWTNRTGNRAGPWGKGAARGYARRAFNNEARILTIGNIFARSANSRLT
jgi:hypothetical protein